ncbi:MAG: type II toxin-antitoxin system death-on-curing family toxin [Rubrobacteraceae bacterium]|jgi:death-on-curing protein|nr:type II toxin-antitoxin system death-on-curing family toxin [Rubrobacter sp.]
MRNPDLRRVLFAHTVLIERYGGAEGVRDPESLKAAIERPWGSSFGQEHFPGPFRKAAALCESLIRRHPFMDGNKRTGVTMGSYLLSTFGCEVEAAQQELEDFGVDVAQGMFDTGQIAVWFEDHAESL